MFIYIIWFYYTQMVLPHIFVLKNRLWSTRHNSESITSTIDLFIFKSLQTIHYVKMHQFIIRFVGCWLLWV
jgi:hypothetical protein